MRGSQIFIALVSAFLLFTVGASGQSSQDCLLCHSDPTLTMEKRGRSISIFIDTTKLQRSVHESLNCIDCHRGLDPNEIPHARVIKNVQCQVCHDATAYRKSVHAFVQKDDRGRVRKTAAAECKDCHGTHEILPHGEPESVVSRAHLSETCGKCHAFEVEHFSKSAHGAALSQGIQGAPSCIDCHGEHNIERVASKDSRIYKTHEAKVCLSCHLDNPEVRKRVGPSAGFIAAYEQSVHGIALAEGNDGAATCSNCHGAHDMNKGSNPASKVFKSNVVETCGTCHPNEAKVYRESIHGKVLAQGHFASPTCTDCHGEHQILAPRDPRSPVAAGNVSVQVCSPCHTSVKLTTKFNLPPNRYKTFADSYHGLAIRAGDTEVANCASCHGYHDIKPSSDPNSLIHKANLVVTCGKCHPGANENFAKGSVHVTASREEEAVIYWVSTIYISLIVVVIGGMFLHNLSDFIRKARREFQIRRGVIHEEATGRSLYLRMTVNERLQHGILLVSFLILVITGFMLRYPDAWWVVWIRQLSDSVFQLRSISHRVAGVVLVAASLYHIYYIFFTDRGKKLIRDLLPRLQDIRDVLGVLRFNLGLSAQKPKFGRFSYVEKSEYWALVWGTIVMAATGVILWFDNTFMGLLTKLGWDVARTIHFYEAWLATLAIVVWHFYYVLLNPDIYPMNLAWLTGTVTEAEMLEEHPLELEEIRRERDLEQSSIRAGTAKVLLEQNDEN